MGFLSANQIADASISSDSATASAFQDVMTRISIEKKSDLFFGQAPQGDREKTVLAGTSETSENASFVVTGDPDRSYTILLPTDGSVTMTNVSSGTEIEKYNKIEVYRFTSFPLSFEGHLDSQGRQTIYVGATRQALHPRQSPGRYVGSFSITVVY